MKDKIYMLVTNERLDFFVDIWYIQCSELNSNCFLIKRGGGTVPDEARQPAVCEGANSCRLNV